jgi:hypothetical protein
LGAKEQTMRTKESKRLLSEFLLDLRTLSQEKGYQFNSEPSLSFAKQLQLYEFHANNRTYNLFIRVSVEQGFWGVSSQYQEIFDLISRRKENKDWAVILLERPLGRNYPLGYVLVKNEFLKLKPELSIDHNLEIKIEKKHLSLKYRFHNWDTFFQLLEL